MYFNSAHKGNAREDLFRVCFVVYRTYCSIVLILFIIQWLQSQLRCSQNMRRKEMVAIVMFADFGDKRGMRILWGF